MISYHQWKTTDGCDAVSITYPQHQRDAGRSTIMNNQTRQNGSMAIEERVEIVALWRQAVLGDAAARRALLWRIMPASAIEMPPVIIEFDMRRAHRQPDRVAA
jgi:hypothetical protein